jgi:hypothetical protein
MLDVFERKILRRIHGPVRDRDHWRCAFSKELYDTFKEFRLSVVIKIDMLGLAVHVARMEDICMPRRELYTQPEVLRKVRRPRVVCKVEVGKDARMLVCSSHESRGDEETSEGGHDPIS